jgi:hypothetical protein
MADSNRVHKSIICVKFSTFGIGILLLPIGSLFVCVVLSILLNFESATATHCRVANYLPSISAAVGGFTPQRYIWRMCIAIHCGPRLFAVLAYYNSFHQLTVHSCQKLYHLLVTSTTALHLVENFCLLLLTCISSIENYVIHETSFIVFLVCSEFYMFLTCILSHWTRSNNSINQDLRSFQWKVALFVINLSTCGLAAYFFYRHNTYCEPGVYTLFAACEYLIVATNIAFHATAVLDFGQGDIVYSARTLKSLKSL